MLRVPHKSEAPTLEAWAWAPAGAQSRGQAVTFDARVDRAGTDRQNVVAFPAPRAKASRAKTSRCEICGSNAHRSDEGHAQCPECHEGVADVEWRDGIALVGLCPACARAARVREQAEAIALAGSLLPESPLTPATEGPEATYTTASLLDDYAKSRKARGRAAATLSFIACHSKALRRLLPTLARDVDHARLLGYVETRRAEGAGEVVRKELHSVLRPALKLAYKSELFDADPAKVIPELDSLSKPRERWLTVDEAWKVVRWLEARSKAGRDHAACVAFALAAGAEYGAWSHAKRADVREDGDGTRVRGTKRKTRDRFAPAPLPEQQKLLRFALENTAGSGGALFTRWTLDNANTDLREACDALGIARCSTNDLRRSYASWLGQAGVRDELIEKAMGHKGSSVLGRHYRKLTDDDLLRLMLEDLRKEQAVQDDLRTGPNGPTDSRGGPTGDRTRDLRIKKPDEGTTGDAAAEDEPPSNDLNGALAFALREATRAGQWTAVTAIANALASQGRQP